MGMSMNLSDAGNGCVNIPFRREDGRGDGFDKWGYDTGDEFSKGGGWGAGLYHGGTGGDGGGCGIGNYWFYGDGAGIGWVYGFALLFCDDPLWLICAGAIK